MNSFCPALRAGVMTLCALFFLSGMIYAQTKPEVLTNQKVISLVKAGLDNSIIINAIDGSECQFDLSVNGLVSLKAQKVPREVIEVMQGKTAPVKKRVDEGPRFPGVPNATTPKIEVMNHPYLLRNPKGGVDPLDKCEASIVGKARGFGYGGMTMLYEVEGLKAKLRKVSGDTIIFLVNSGSLPPEFVLYRAETKKEKRFAASMTSRPLKGTKSANNTITCNTVTIGNGLYKLVPSQKLEAGEYFFTGKPVGSTGSIEAFAFGID